MKKLFFYLLMGSFFAACNGNESTTTKTSPDSTGGPNMPAVDNVNGNMPDTTINLNQSLPKDSSRTKDSTHH